MFAPSSPRTITPDGALAIARTLPPFLHRVGVFVDLPAAEVRRIAEHVGLDAVQLHGRETPADAAGAWPRVIKALARDRDPAAEATAWPASVTLLLDAATGDAPGGTGQLADWPRRRGGSQRRLCGGRPDGDKVGEASASCARTGRVSSGSKRGRREVVARMRAFARAVDAA